MATTQGIKLDDDTKQRLKSLGEKRDRSPHYLMKTAIADYLKREERYEREKAEDQERWEEYLITGESISHAEVSKLLQDFAEGKEVQWPQ